MGEDSRVDCLWIKSEWIPDEAGKTSRCIWKNKWKFHFYCILSFLIHQLFLLSQTHWRHSVWSSSLSTQILNVHKNVPMVKNWASLSCRLRGHKCNFDLHFRFLCFTLWMNWIYQLLIRINPENLKTWRTVTYSYCERRVSVILSTQFITQAK